MPGFDIVGWIIMAAALCGAAYQVVTGVLVSKFFQCSMAERSDFPPVTLLKPLHLAEEGLDENLESFCRQDYPAPVQIVFGVQGRIDSAIPVVEALRARHPHIDIKLVTGARREGSNPKIANLLGMIPEALHELLVLSDSDIGVQPDYLRRVVAALESPGVGAVTCCYTGAALGNVWSQLSAMGIDYQFLPSVVTGITLGLAKPCFGSTIAVHKSMLARIGGFEAFRDRLADDYEVGHAVRALGYRVAVPPIVVAHTCTESSMTALLRHELRWARTIRGIDQAGYAGSAITHAFPLGLIAAGMLGFSSPALLGLAVTFVARMLLKFKIDRIFKRSGGPALLVPFRDMVSFAVFVSSYFLRQVDWRGSRYVVQAGGQLAQE